MSFRLPVARTAATNSGSSHAFHVGSIDDDRVRCKLRQLVEKRLGSLESHPDVRVDDGKTEVHRRLDEPGRVG